VAITTYNNTKTSSKVDDDSKEFKEFNQALREHGFKMWRSPYKVNCTTDDMQKNVNNYFTLCDTYGQLPSIKGLCVYLGITTIMFNNNINNPESGYRDIFAGAKDYIHSVIENRAMNGKVSSSVYQFTAQNFYDMSTQQNVNITTNGQLTLNVENSEETINALKNEIMKQVKARDVQYISSDAIIVKEDMDE